MVETVFPSQERSFIWKRDISWGWSDTGCYELASDIPFLLSSHRTVMVDLERSITNTSPLDATLNSKIFYNRRYIDLKANH